MHIFRLGSTLVLLSAGGLVCAFTNAFDLGGFLSIQGASLLLFAAIGTLVGSFSQRFSPRTVVILSMIALLAGIALCFGLAAILERGCDMLDWFLCVLSFVSSLIYTGCLFLEARTIRRFCVR